MSEKNTYLGMDLIFYVTYTDQTLRKHSLKYQDIGVDSSSMIHDTAMNFPINLTILGKSKFPP